MMLDVFLLVLFSKNDVDSKNVLKLSKLCIKIYGGGLDSLFISVVYMFLS